MLIKVSLIVAVVALLAAAALTHLQVAQRVATLQNDFQTTTKDLNDTRARLDKTDKDLKSTKSNLDQKTKDLEETQTNLESATSKANAQEARANKAEEDLNKSKKDLTEALRELGAWRTLGISVDEVGKKLVELAKANEANVALNDEKKVMNRNILQLKTELAKWVKEDVERPPEMPPVKGKVVAVEPKWDFVILDIGANQGLVERGQLLISRQGRLVAKVRLTSVEPNRAIANVLPEWKQVEVLEGDQVLN